MELYYLVRKPGCMNHYIMSEQKFLSYESFTYYVVDTGSLDELTEKYNYQVLE